MLEKLARLKERDKKKQPPVSASVISRNGINAFEGEGEHREKLASGLMLSYQQEPQI